MKTSIRNKKGFTIVELVIVIAVIAILAAVLIPTFANLVEKANQSADIQAVRQMNTHLAIDEIDSNKTIQDVYDALSEGGMSAENYTPLQSDTYFYWIKELNRIVYVGSDDKVIFPEEYEGKDLASVAGDPTTYISLNGQVDVAEVKKEEVISGTKATISNGEELYWLTQGENMEGVTEIVFDESEIELHGASAVIVVGETLTITGKEGGTTIKGLVAVDSKYAEEYTADGTDKNYAAGFVSYVKKSATLTMSNITLDGATVGGYEIGGVGGLIGRIAQETNKVTITNCKVINSVINGQNKVGALIGSIGSATVEIKECLVDNCTVNCSEGESGKVIGCVYNGGLNLTIDQAFDKWVTNTTLNLVSTDKRDVVDGSKFSYSENDGQSASNNVADCQKIVRQVVKGDQIFRGRDTKNEEVKSVVKSDNVYPAYRMFANDAYMTALNNSTNMTIKIGETTVSDIKNLTDLKCTMKLDDETVIVNILKFFK